MFSRIIPRSYFSVFFFPLYGFYLLFFVWLRVASCWWWHDCSHLWRWKELRWARPAWWWGSPGRKWQHKDWGLHLSDPKWQGCWGISGPQAELGPARAGECCAWSPALNACSWHFWWWRESPGSAVDWSRGCGTELLSVRIWRDRRTGISVPVRQWTAV